MSMVSIIRAHQQNKADEHGPDEDDSSIVLFVLFLW